MVNQLSILELSRYSEWWEYKLLPAVMIGLATSLHLNVSPVANWQAFVWLIAILVPGGVFVSVLNDLTDLKDDQLAEKKNRLSGKPLVLPVLVASLCLISGVVILWFWRGQPFICIAYAAGWIAYLAYSLPPIRLKARGFSGALSDAIGANVVPASLGALLVASTAQETLDWFFLGSVGIWSLCFGLRGIFWHQILDAPLDLKSNVTTFVVRIGIEPTMNFARLVIFPLEIGALAAILLHTGLSGFVFSLTLFGIYLWFLIQRLNRFQMLATLVKPRPRSVIILHEYYDVFLPLAFILAASIFDPLSLVLLPLLLIVFPNRFLQTIKEIRRLFDPQFERSR